MPTAVSRELLVGLDTRDDAAIFKINENEALVQTVDFFTPIVDDPYLFGQIAATNALSDIYAMGGKPLTAMNLAGFPCKMDFDILARILQGGRDKVEEAGAVVVGGHTVEDPEPKYGLSITGIIDPNRVITVAAAKPGDALVLTKPLGVGILSTALKAGFISEEDMIEAIDGMRHLNDRASEAMIKVGVRACTDITGFGLLGHLYTMAAQSGVSAVITADAVPVWSRVRELTRRGLVTGGASKNRDYLKSQVAFETGVGEITQDILFDPQTSGGLLISVSKERVDDLVRLLQEAKTPAVSVIGEIVEDKAGTIRVTGG
jgi:selenide,water dikinase